MNPVFVLIRCALLYRKHVCGVRDNLTECSSALLTEELHSLFISKIFTPADLWFPWCPLCEKNCQNIWFEHDILWLHQHARWWRWTEHLTLHSSWYHARLNWDPALFQMCLVPVLVSSSQEQHFLTTFALGLLLRDFNLYLDVCTAASGQCPLLKAVYK